MTMIKQYASLLENEIKSALDYDSKPAGLYEPIAYGLDTGGKRLRPVLALMAASACGASAEAAMPAALAVEMFHNFTLLHDDVMDSSPTRRGKPSVWKRWDVNTAILSGDTMFALCYRQIMRLPAEVLPSALKMFTDSAVEVMEGQQLDMDFENRDDVTLSEYLEMIRLKTSVLLGCAAAMGAIAAGADETAVRSFYTYGEALGLAFQIQDDLLDVYGDPATFGKPIGGDILNAKKTFLLLSCLEGSHADELRRAMSLPADETRIRAVRAVYDEAGIPGLCHEAIARYTKEAVDALALINMPEPLRGELADLALGLADRKK